MRPLVSVIMPVFNAGLYISESLESVLNQSYTNFELLIFNDGSSDNTLEVIKSYEDSRIKVFDYDKNIGLVEHLNHGLRVAAGKYIARMDADDIANNERFSSQVDFLEKNPHIGVCGSWAFRFTGDAKCVSHRDGAVWKTAEDNDEIIRFGLKRCPIIHPTAMLRAEIIKRNNLRYDQQWYPAEDYQFWFELSRFTRLANIPKVLLLYRDHADNISKSRTQTEKAALIRSLQVIKYFQVICTDDNTKALTKLFSDARLTRSELRLIDDLFLDILSSERAKMESAMTKGLLRSYYENYVRINPPERLDDLLIVSNKSVRLLKFKTVLRYFLRYIIRR